MASKLDKIGADLKKALQKRDEGTLSKRIRKEISKPKMP